MRIKYNQWWIQFGILGRKNFRLISKQSFGVSCFDFPSPDLRKDTHSALKSGQRTWYACGQWRYGSTSDTSSHPFWHWAFLKRLAVSPPSTSAQHIYRSSENIPHLLFPLFSCSISYKNFAVLPRVAEVIQSKQLEGGETEIMISVIFLIYTDWTG